MADVTESLTPSSTPSIPHSRPMPVREDCWSEEATSTLIDAWGRRYLELNRGNLRQKDWQDVAEAVNALHGHTKKTHRTDVQCKNRIDTIKKKYKIEKARVSSSNCSVSSSWPFFERVDALIGPNIKKLSPVTSFSPLPPVAVPLPYKKIIASSSSMMAGTMVVVPQKRSSVGDEGYFRRNYSAMAAAAAAAEADEDEEDLEEGEEVEMGEEDEEEMVVRRRENVEESEDRGEGIRVLARAIERFAKVYERVEGEKVRHMVEVEKQRMQFAKDLELQRMQMFMDTQVELERIKRGKRSRSNGHHSEGPISVLRTLTCLLIKL